jgi:hypothetical protein
MKTGSWDFMHFCTEFWQFFMATGKHATSWKSDRLDSLILAISPQMPNATLEMNTNIIKALAESVLIIYDDAMYKLEIDDSGSSRWVLIGTDKITCKSEEDGLCIGVVRCKDTNSRRFLLRQSDNSFCSTGFDLLMKQTGSLDDFLDQWLYKSCQRVFEEIED